MSNQFRAYSHRRKNSKRENTQREETLKRKSTSFKGRERILRSLEVKKFILKKMAEFNAVVSFLLVSFKSGLIYSKFDIISIQNLFILQFSFVDVHSCRTFQFLWECLIVFYEKVSIEAFIEETRIFFDW